VTEHVLTELNKLRDGLEIRISMLRPDVASYFQKDYDRLQKLIEELTTQQLGS
jgi:hypothetical protein